MKRFQRLNVLLGLALSLTTGWSAVVNDGTSLASLTKFSNSSPNSTGDATVELTADPDGFLAAAQSGTCGFFPVRTTWYATDTFPTSGVYTVAADFRPTDVTSERRGGVMGWLDVSTGKGISFQVWPAGQRPSFQIKVIDFNANEANANESLIGLFNLDGAPATEELTSAGAELGTNYVATNFATLQLDFTLPNAADLTAVTNATVRITAKVIQGVDLGGTPIQVSRTIELLSNLPAPEAVNHRFGYFAYWASFFAPGETIGYLDNLSGFGVGQVPNASPIVSLSNPAGGAVFDAPATISISANASDADGSVLSVEFYEGTTLLGSVTNTPFDFTWNNVPSGNYSLTARAIDNRGGTSTSAAVNVTVNSSSGTGPPLSIARNGTNLVISWSGTGYQLQMNTNLSSSTTWSNVGDTVNTDRATVLLTTENTFFRLVRAGAPTGPRLSIRTSGNSIVVSWPSQVTGYRLQARTDFSAATWTDIPTTNNQHTESAPGPTRFYRLINGP